MTHTSRFLTGGLLLAGAGLLFASPACAPRPAAPASVPAAAPAAFAGRLALAGVGNAACVAPGLYRGEIAFREIPDSLTLHEALAPADGLPPPLRARRAVLLKVARALRTLHDAGGYHADLHARNVLLAGPDRALTWIDLEKSTVGGPLALSARVRNFVRLNRSVDAR